jgi:CBS domain containing-hemolysin-like protein
MQPWEILALAGIFAVYVATAVFRSAHATLSPVALRRILGDDARRGSGGAADLLGIRVAFDFVHHTTLIAASVLMIAAESRAGTEHPYLVSLGLLVAGALVAQLGGRALALLNPERAFAITWSVAAQLYRIFSIVARPLIAALDKLRLASRREWAEEEPEAAAEEIEALIEAGRSEGILEVEEGRLIRQVVDFHDRIVRELMTPRTEIVAIRAEASIGELRALMVREKHSRVPVYRGQIDNIEGVVHLRDLLACWGVSEDGAPIAPLIKPAYFVPETKQVSDLLRELQKRRTQLAVVVDEYGGTAGIATIEDLLEEIVGEIQEEHEGEEPEIAPDGEGRFLLRGTATVDALNAALGTGIPAEGFETVSGLITSVLGRIPRAGEIVQQPGVRLEIVKADSRRILSVRALKTSGAPAGPPPGRGGR